MEQYIAMMNASEHSFEELKRVTAGKLPEIEHNDLSGKIVVITGANVGIGYETAKAIASMNPKKIILACRNADKAKTAIEKIKDETNYKEEIEAWNLDLASFQSVQDFANKFLDTKLPLDILVSNAGVVTNDWTETIDGLEITQQVNHISNVLLISSLYPAMQRAAELNKGEINNKFPRIVVVASNNHFWIPIPLHDNPHPLFSVLQKKEEAGQARMNYPISKLFNILFVQAFARKCPDSKNIWICSSNPGFTQSELGTKDAISGESYGTPRPGFIPARTTYEGAKTIIHSATSFNVGETGKYFSEMQESKTRSSTTGETGIKFSENLWNDTIDILKKHVPYSHVYDW